MDRNLPDSLLFQRQFRSFVQNFCKRCSRVGIEVKKVNTCMPHTDNHVGEAFNTPLLDEFMAAYNTVNVV
jgi:hypothetical protein